MTKSSIQNVQFLDAIHKRDQIIGTKSIQNNISMLNLIGQTFSTRQTYTEYKWQHEYQAKLAGI